MPSTLAAEIVQVNKRLKVVFLGLPTITASDVAECFAKKLEYYWVMVPIGIARLASVLENQDCIESLECLDYCLELENGSEYGSYEKFIDGVASKIDYEPDILAYSINYSPQHDFFIRCEKQLKTKWPNSLTIVGGSHVANSSREYFDLSSVDYLVRGEAEVSFPQMLEKIASGKLDEVDLIHGVYSKKSISTAKTLVFSEQSDPEKLPLPSWHIFDMDRYSHSFQTLIYGSEICMLQRSVGHKNRKTTMDYVQTADRGLH